jgi:hypothetical protein
VPVSSLKLSKSIAEKLDPDTSVRTPDNLARARCAFRFEDKFEKFRDADATRHFETGARGRKVANTAVEGGTSSVKNDAPRLQSPLTAIGSVIRHREFHADKRL